MTNIIDKKHTLPTKDEKVNSEDIIQDHAE